MTLCLRGIAAERDNPAASSDTANDNIPVARSADRGTKMVGASVVDFEVNVANEDAGKDGNILAMELRGDIFLILD
ncbi:hypothetical protein EG68_08586 [Paragonimus skrjabini miyazakii]|uniref:Uncharacterized protein n=1 Tax=Paragonimus skrjabini miyazakii TaxID=59628 RepID=A0A8S9YHD4_9TREM|nr:hypothetical protein EG68_08586 [Paragonimus skrjabini miyazakii]